MKLALEITRQVASGLAAVNKKSLVHRDIKPSNIMVSFEEEGAVTAKIIDLGLAKIFDESGSSDHDLSERSFCRDAGVCKSGTNSRRGSGYPFGSLLTGNFALADAYWSGAISGQCRSKSWRNISTLRCRSKSSKAIPQPVVSLVEVLLSKDPARRFQTPAELLKALPAITDAIEKGSTIAYTSLGQLTDQHGCSATRKRQQEVDRRGSQ